jgi:DNA-binding GntR family transcriptional regulator
VNHIFFSSLRVPPDRVSLLEHQTVLQLLLQGSVAAASAALRGHLLQSEKRTLRRLKVLSVLPEPALPPFLERLS